jgi:hypothetical protein
MHAKFWTENLREADHLGDLNMDERNAIKIDFKEIIWMGLYRVCLL